MAIFKRKTTEDEQIKTAVDVSGSTDEKKETMKDLYKTNKNNEKEVVSTEQSKKSRYGNAYKVLVKPLITEKASDLGALNQYVFEVDKKTNKIEVAKAINEVYGISPTSVNIVRMKGKTIKRGRTTGRRKDWKKAIITLPKGKTISIYEGV